MADVTYLRDSNTRRSYMIDKRPLQMAQGQSNNNSEAPTEMDMATPGLAESFSRMELEPQEKASLDSSPFRYNGYLPDGQTSISSDSENLWWKLPTKALASHFHDRIVSVLIRWHQR